MANQLLCFLCFEYLDNVLFNTAKTNVFTKVVDQNNDSSFPMFVTWKNNGNLRGCKGSFRSLPLYEGLKNMTSDAAFNDSRFEPIEKQEFTKLSCSVSLLHGFEEASNPLDWEIGIHGIRLFLDGRSSTYLPHVAKEHHWDKMETLSHLARKGGFKGKFDESCLQRAKVERYQAMKMSATWDEYNKFVLNE